LVYSIYINGEFFYSGLLRSPLLALLRELSILTKC